MARVTTCRFCNRTSINHDHDECAKAFFKGLNDQVMRWHVNHLGRQLPADIVGKFTSAKYMWYLEYAEREKNARYLERRCAIIAEKVERKLRDVANKITKKSHPDLQVRVKVECKVTPAMTFKNNQINHARLTRGLFSCKISYNIKSCLAGVYRLIRLAIIMYNEHSF